MALWEFKLPDIGEGVTEGEVVAWADGIVVGCKVVADQALAEVMTDKATVTITSPKAGVIVALGAAAGQIVLVGNNLVVLELDGAAAAPAAPEAPKAEAKKENAATAVGDIKEDLPGMRIPSPKAASAPKPTQSAAYFAAKPLATPATRKLARDLGVDLRTVPPTGPNARATNDDVRKAASGNANLPVPLVDTKPSIPVPATTPSTPPPAPGAMKIAAPSAEESDPEERTPLKGVRKKIFEQMGRSVHTAAHFTFVEECDVTALKELRGRLKPKAEAEGVKLTFLPFIAKATLAALKKHPSLNSAFDESTNEIVRRKYFHLGIASSTETGLIVPVVRNADRLSILGLAREIERLGQATKEGKISPKDLGGSTFTITSLGAQGGLFATPILNFPEVGILGVHQMKQKPVVRGGEIVIGDVMLLSLSFDHRIIDGHVGAAFAYEIIRYLENPDALFLEMA